MAASTASCDARVTVITHALWQSRFGGDQSIIGRSEIGCDVMIASRVSIISDRYLHGHPSDRVRGVEVRRDTGPPSIGDECWLGENSVVMADLGPRCTVAAGAVVSRPAEAGTTLMGNPARKVNL